MKKNILISLLVVAMGVMAFLGCEKEKIENPTTLVTTSQTTENPSANPQGEPASVIHNTNLSYTDCQHNQRDGLYGVYEEILSNYDNGVLQLFIDNLRLTCGEYNVTAVSEIDANTINVDLKVIYESQADCVCRIDVDYSIDNIKPGNYELIINYCDLVIYQEEIVCE